MSPPRAVDGHAARIVVNLNRAGDVNQLYGFVRTFDLGVARNPRPR